MSQKSLLPIEKSLRACAIGAGFAGLTCIFVTGLKGGLSSDLLLFNLFLSVIAAMGAFLGLVAIGMPVQAQMQKRGLTGMLSHVVLSTIVGGLLISLLWGFGWNSVSLGSAMGFAGGISAWLVRRPDKDVPKALP